MDPPPRLKKLSVRGGVRGGGEEGAGARKIANKNRKKNSFEELSGTNASFSTARRSALDALVPDHPSKLRFRPVSCILHGRRPSSPTTPGGVYPLKVRPAPPPRGRRSTPAAPLGRKRVAPLFGRRRARPANRATLSLPARSGCGGREARRAGRARGGRSNDTAAGACGGVAASRCTTTTLCCCGPRRAARTIQSTPPRTATHHHPN